MSFVSSFLFTNDYITFSMPTVSPHFRPHSVYFVNTSPMYFFLPNFNTLDLINGLSPLNWDSTTACLNHMECFCVSICLKGGTSPPVLDKVKRRARLRLKIFF